MQMESKERIKSCDCKGKRSCLLCEKLLNKVPRDFLKEFQVNFDKAIREFYLN